MLGTSLSMTAHTPTFPGTKTKPLQVLAKKRIIPLWKGVELEKDGATIWMQTYEGQYEEWRIQRRKVLV